MAPPYCSNSFGLSMTWPSVLVSKGTYFIVTGDYSVKRDLSMPLPSRSSAVILSKETYDSVKETYYSVKRDLSMPLPSRSSAVILSKETYDSVKRDLL
jgi:hypothetical protein